MPVYKRITEEECKINVFHQTLWDPGQMNIMGRYHSMYRMSLLVNTVWNYELVLIYLVLAKTYDN